MRPFQNEFEKYYEILPTLRKIEALKKKNGIKCGFIETLMNEFDEKIKETPTNYEGYMRRNAILQKTIKELEKEIEHWSKELGIDSN